MIQKTIKTIIALILCLCLFAMLQLVAIPFSLQDSTQYVVTIIRIIAAIISIAVLAKVLRKIYIS